MRGYRLWLPRATRLAVLYACVAARGRPGCLQWRAQDFVPGYSNGGAPTGLPVRCALRCPPDAGGPPSPVPANRRRSTPIGKNERERAYNPTCESETGGRRWERDFGPPKVKMGRSASLGHRWERKPSENWTYLPVQVFRLLYFCFFIQTCICTICIKNFVKKIRYSTGIPLNTAGPATGCLGLAATSCYRAGPL
jgi:hypothetical protein